MNEFGFEASLEYLIGSNRLGVRLVLVYVCHLVVCMKGHGGYYGIHMKDHGGYHEKCMKDHGRCTKDHSGYRGSHMKYHVRNHGKKDCSGVVIARLWEYHRIHLV